MNNDKQIELARLHRDILKELAVNPRDPSYYDGNFDGKTWQIIQALIDVNLVERVHRTGKVIITFVGRHYLGTEEADRTLTDVERVDEIDRVWDDTECNNAMNVDAHWMIAKLRAYIEALGTAAAERDVAINRQISALDAARDGKWNSVIALLGGDK